MGAQNCSSVLFGSLKYHQEGLLCAGARINPNCCSEYKCPLCCAIALTPGEEVWDPAKQIRGRTAPAKVLQCCPWNPRISSACGPSPPHFPQSKDQTIQCHGGLSLWGSSDQWREAVDCPRLQTGLLQGTSKAQLQGRLGQGITEGFL